MAATEREVTETGKRDARVIGLVSAGHFVSHLYILLLPPLFVFIKADYGLSYAEVGLILASFNIVSAALQTPTGFVVDRWGAGRLLIVGLLLASIALTAASFTPSYWGLVVCFAFVGLANTVFHPADYAILSHRVAPRRIGTAFSIHTFAGLLGTAAAPVSMLTATRLWGWHGAIMAAAVVGFVAAVVLFAQRRSLSFPTPAPAARAASNGGDGWRLLFSPPILRNLAFFTLLSLASGGISGFSIVALAALYDTALGVANLALSTYLFLSALGVLCGGLIADRTHHHTRVAAAGFAASAAAIFVVGAVGLAAPVLVLLMAAAGLLNGVIQPSRDMIVRAVTPSGSFGKVFGFVTTGFNIGGVIAPLLYGWLMDQGQPRAVFMVVVAITLVSLLTVSTARVPAPKPAAAE